MGGEINNELFKKLENTDGIWEFRTKYSGIAYRLFSFWDTETETLVIDAWNYQENSENPIKGNCQS